MKKILSAVLAAVLCICCFTLPCMAEGNKSIKLDIEYNAETKLLTFSGNAAAGYGAYSATFYLLKPGKIQQDIETHSNENPVIENCGQFKIASDGTFSHTLKLSGDAGIYTLYFKAAGISVVEQIDTSGNITPEALPLDELHALPTSYPAATGTTTKELFEEKLEEYGTEMPVVKPASTEGLMNIFIDVQNGNDSTATGTITSPYKTVKQAMAENPPKSGMAYVLREGTYPITDSVTISNVNADEKTPVIVTNYGDEKVTFVGGTKINSSDFTKVTDNEIIQRLDPAVIGDVYVVDLKGEYGITDYGKISTSSAPVLFVGESKYQIARWPNSDTTTMKKYTGPEQDGTTGVIDSGYNNIGVGSNVGPARPYSKRATANNEAAGEIVDKDQGFQFCVTDLRPFSWVNTGDIWVYGRFYDEWTLNHFNISEFHPENGSIRTATGLNWGCQYKAGNTFYYYNVLEELDAPGEWYMDKETGKLYVYPTEDLFNSEIIYASSDKTMMNITSSKNVIINGIGFEHSRGRGITFSGNTCENIIVQNCSFENLGSGVYVTGKYTGVINSKFKNLDDKAVYLAEDTNLTKSLTPAYQFVQNNVMYYTKGISANGVGPIISHNFISNNKGSCINTGTNEAVIEYNEITGGPQIVEDSGAMYIGGNNLFRRGNHVRYNYIHDAPAAPRAIYFDDMAAEYYAYGNIVANGGWMQIHNGSEHTVYNNIFMNNTTKSYILNGSPNYFNQSRSGSVRWRVGSLEYGSMTAKLKAGSGYNALEGAYAERYPYIKTWAELMYERIAEYEDLVADGMDKVTAAKTCNIASEYTDSKGYNYNLNEYLAACRDNYVENNLMINTNGVTMGQDGKTDGYIRTVYENNVSLTSAQNPFEGTTFADESAYDKVREHIPGFETIPFEEIGLLSEEDYTINAKTKAISPVNTTDVAISAKDLSLQWEAVDGAQKYFLEISRNENFTDIIEQASTFELSHKVIETLTEDTVYYWRVTTIPLAECSTGSSLVSDTFKFKTLAGGQEIARNQIGVTSYSVDNIESDNFKVTTYVYNLKEEDADAIVYIGCFDATGRLIAVKSQTVTVAAGTIDGEYEFNITAPNTDLIKLFVWSADGNMIPYTFVKTIK